MNIYMLNEGNLIPTEKISLNQLIILDNKELLLYSEYLSIPKRIAAECQTNQGTKFECYDGFDYIVLNLPQVLSLKGKPKHLCIYFSKNSLLFICEKPDFLINFINTLSNQIKIENLGKFLRLFLDHFTHDDRNVLIGIEEEIADLEEEFIVSIKNNLIDYISDSRRELLGLKQYYEQLLDIAEGIEENENKLIDQKELRYFKILTNRINRLLSNVLNLRDYLTQVREAYQAQLDISLNNVMKLFTVITSIFLPLSLIVGWYGMNLKMPEYKWIYGYPFVIILSLFVALGTLFYFKKNKWF